MRFAEFREFEGRSLPSRFTVSVADREFATFVVDKADLVAGPPATPAATDPNKK